MKQYGIRLFSVLSAVLLAVLAWLWVNPQGNLRNVTWQPPEPVAPALGGQIPDLPMLKAMDTSMFMATLDRPLFSPSRRPAPKGVEGAKPEESAPDLLANIHVYGLYTSDDGVPGVLARVDGKTRRIASGEPVSGWVLKSVQDRQAIFARDGQERAINLATVRPGTPKVAKAPEGGGAQTAAVLAAPPSRSSCRRAPPCARPTPSCSR